MGYIALLYIVRYIFFKYAVIIVPNKLIRDIFSLTLPFGIDVIRKTTFARFLYITHPFTLVIFIVFDLLRRQINVGAVLGLARQRIDPFRIERCDGRLRIGNLSVNIGDETFRRVIIVFKITVGGFIIRAKHQCAAANGNIDLGRRFFPAV